MRVQTEEWQRFIPGVRMYKGRKTYFYNGQSPWNPHHLFMPHVYEQRQAIEVIIVLPGVEIISNRAFEGMTGIEVVIMADNVRRIEEKAFHDCTRLSYVRLSRNLEYIGPAAFLECLSLKSIFVPPSCREIGLCAFERCLKLIIFNVHQNTELRTWALVDTSLIMNSASVDEYRQTGDIRSIAWVKTINDDDEYGLHRLCSSMDPSEDEIYEMICEQGGLCAMTKENSIGITPSEYLASNPYADVDETKLIKRFVLEKMGGKHNHL